MANSRKSKKPELVKSVDELRKALKDGKTSFAIALNFGLFSRKVITQAKTSKKFKVFNSIDDTTQYLTEKEIVDKSISNIGAAMKRKAFYVLQD